MRAGLGGLVRESGAWRIGAGALAALAGVVLLVVALLPEPKPPPPDPATAARANREASAKRLTQLWHSTPVQGLFPDRIQVDADAPPNLFTRVGVAPEATCPEVLDPALIAGFGVPCERVLRATYVDSTRAVVATAGIVVLDQPPPAEPRVPGTLSGDVLLMRAYGVRDTDAARFSDEQRLSSGTAMLVGEPQAPYLLAVVVGAVDGRPPAKLPSGFDSESRREADRAEWRLAGEDFLVGFKNAIYEAIQASKSRAARP